MNLQNLLGEVLGTGDGHARRGGDHAPGRPEKGSDLTDQLGGMLSGRGGSALGGALAGGLASQLFKGKRMKKMGGSAAKMGGAAIVAGLAYKAYQSYQAKNGQGGGSTQGGNAAPQAQGEIPSPEKTGFLPAGEEEAQAKLMLSAMIAAAKADGYIDADEEKTIFARIDEMGLDAEEKGFLMDEMRHPMSAAELAAKARTRETAMDVYTASLLAIDVDHPAEEAYLDRLANQLGLPEDLAAEMRRTTGEVQEAGETA